MGDGWSQIIRGPRGHKPEGREGRAATSSGQGLAPDVRMQLVLLLATGVRVRVAQDRELAERSSSSRPPASNPERLQPDSVMLPFAVEEEKDDENKIK